MFLLFVFKTLTLSPVSLYISYPYLTRCTRSFLTSPDDAPEFRTENLWKIIPFFPTQPWLPVFLVFITRDAYLRYYSEGKISSKTNPCSLSLRNWGITRTEWLKPRLRFPATACVMPVTVNRVRDESKAGKCISLCQTRALFTWRQMMTHMIPYRRIEHTVRDVTHILTGVAPLKITRQKHFWNKRWVTRPAFGKFGLILIYYPSFEGGRFISFIIRSQLRAEI